jgi:uncharacterized protein (TIGR02145 family)
MKKIYFLLAGLLLTASLLLPEHSHAQVPQSMSYQGVIRGSDNALVVTAPVGLKISMLQGSDSGTPVYVETQTATTNPNGFVSFAIGTGTVVTGSFAGINWAMGPYFIKTEIDPTGGSNYSITGAVQTNSVPYGLYGKNGVQPGTAAGQMKYWNGSTWLVIEPILNTISKLQFLNGLPVWVPVTDAPTIGAATPGTGQATITYTAPANNGGAAITSYTATSAPGGLTGTLSQAGSGTITVTGLTNGTAYTFTVTATNAAGTSIASAASNAVTPYTVPGAPIIGTATVGTGGSNGRATITFTAPSNNGGTVITSYKATSSPDGKTGTVTQAGSGTILVTNLTYGTAYTFTVTATNAAGTSAASTASNSVTPLVSVTIDTQVWTLKNLDVTTYTDGTVIPQVTVSTEWAAMTTGAWCYYANVTANGTTYGKLYNWYAVAGIYDAASSTNTALRKKLAPTGWHIPTDGEWTTLSTFLGGTTVAGGEMKETGITLWTTPNTGATNSSGFAGRPGGYRESTGTFLSLQGLGVWWSSSEYFSNALLRTLGSSSGGVGGSSGNRKTGQSVRCVRD